MKKIILISTILLGLIFSSCRRHNELPPLNTGYAKNVVLPEPTDLTSEERAELEKIKQEYEDATK